MTKNRFALIALALASAASAATIQIPADQATIQSGIDAASDGDTVLVAPGTYSEAIQYHGKAVTVTSEAPWDSCVVAATVIDASTASCWDLCSVVRFVDGEGPGSVLAGFTLTGGTGSKVDRGLFWDYRWGGGIFCKGASPRIWRCVVRGNEVPGGSEYLSSDGGGICCDHASPTIEECTIANNTAQGRGAGIACMFRSRPLIRRCRIVDNRSASSGGGIGTNYRSGPTLVDCEISRNWAMHGGGVMFWSDAERSSELIRCTIVDNVATASGGGGIYCAFGAPLISSSTIAGNWGSEGGGLYCDQEGFPSLINCVVWNNAPLEIGADADGDASITYSDVRDGWPGEGNIDADPRFCDGACDRLRSFGVAADSPCLGNGFSGADMGAWGEDCSVPSVHVPARLRVPADHATLRAALRAACAGDTIVVDPGTYPEPELVIPALDLELRGSDPDDPAVVAATAIEGGGRDLIRFTPSRVKEQRLVGLTLTGGVTALYCNEGSPLIDRCLITGNSAGTTGCIHFRHSNATLTRCEIVANSIEPLGAAIYCNISSPTISGCVIRDNEGGFANTVMKCGASSSPLIHNCLISDNVGDDEPIECYDSAPVFSNCTIVNNHAQRPSRAAILSWNSTMIFHNSIVWGNTPGQIDVIGFGTPLVRYSDVEGGWAGPGNIDADPRFFTWTDVPYLLLPGSPCIDAGQGDPDAIPWSDFHAGYGAGNGADPDMGAYGGPGGDLWLGAEEDRTRRGGRIPATSSAFTRLDRSPTTRSALDVRCPGPKPEAGSRRPRRDPL